MYRIYILSIVLSLVLSGCSLLPGPTKQDAPDEETIIDAVDTVAGKTRDDFSNEEKMNIHICLMGYGDGCETILDINNKHIYADAIQEQCDIMPGMEVCDTYFGLVDTQVEDTALDAQYNLDAQDNYPSVADQDVVLLEDGDRHAITLENATTTIDGKDVRMMTYNGSVPGPLIKVKQGSTIQLSVTNNIADITSTVHHHGLRLDDASDGVPVSMGGFDVPAKQGETLTYELRFPDPGIYRYHPHVREDLQQELGMYGNYVVVPDDPTYRNPVDDEQVLILDDIQMDADGIAPFYKDYTNQTIMGRFGTHYLLNGSESYTLSLTQGQVTRLYVSNTANVRPFALRIPGVQMKLVGGDLGAYEKETMIDTLLIAPAERYVVELYPSNAGEFDIVYDNPAFTEILGTVTVSPNDILSDAARTFSTMRTVDIMGDAKDTYTTYMDTLPDKTLRLDMTLHGATKDDLSLKMIHDHDDAIVAMGGINYNLASLEWEDEMYEMNVNSTDEGTDRQLIDEDTGKISMDIDDRNFKEGDIVKVRIINDGEGLHPMQHPIHFHGQRFLIVNKNGAINTNMVRKDTVLVLPGEYVDILIDMSNPGTWMAHCHIAEHMHAGMMMNFTVAPQEEK